MTDDVLHNETDNALQVSGSLWLHRGTSPLGGQARIALLEHIASHGSITAAAKAAGMSYKAAWDAVDAMNQLAGEPLVARSTGGRGGGGTRLTPRGARLVAAFRAVEAAQTQFLARVANDLEHFDEQWPVIARLGLQTSARNQLHGTITQIRRCGVNDEVTLTLPGGEAITASLTHHSTQSLGLAAGGHAFALIKAPWIEMARGADLAGLPTANRLSGTVEVVTDEAGQAEVILALPGGSRLAAVMPQDTLKARGLTVGVGATAAFAAASVIIGVMA
ncbi:molybdenum-dependent transcriptional regulator [Pandoraea faecigallinarum]|uniref:Molybdenum-dependent transcriptional regulator n=1 Tax=Pandoraea faecigallinarum TaxID=656179 RepID=A0A0H3WSB0_9BURK|nr:TOBE domain-containing protein [Pandoraea faecigallinarum]AKM30652.1 molybdenum-dependent transcriptional regulator [Pandoraea faecigallinarum]